MSLSRPSALAGGPSIFWVSQIKVRQSDPPVDVMPDYQNQNQDLVW